MPRDRFHRQNRPRSIELRDALGRVDIITGTLGKAMGGAMGGFTTGRKEIIEMLRQRSRPYLFSNSLAPSIVGASLEVFNMLSESTELRDRLEENTAYFKAGMRRVGLPIKDGESAIVPVMLGDAKLSQVMANRLLEEGIYVIGFFYPVVPKGEARIRVQLSAAHTREHWIGPSKPSAKSATNSGCSRRVDELRISTRIDCRRWARRLPCRVGTAPARLPFCCVE